MEKSTTQGKALILYNFSVIFNWQKTKLAVLYLQIKAN